MSTSPPTLALYHFDFCPYCVDVRRELEQLGLSAELRDIHKQRPHLSALMAATGRKTVPVLRIEEADGQVRWLPESLDIIDYLRAQQPHAKRPPLVLLRLRRWAPMAFVVAAAFSPRYLALALCAGAVLVQGSRYLQPRRRHPHTST